MKTYFVSDIHLGVPSYAESREKEARFIRFLESVENEMERLFLLGDIFDFWFEYKDVIPKGYVRLFGKLAALSDKGIEIHFFCGNHDRWIREYFSREVGIHCHGDVCDFQIDDTLFFVGHGDGLGKGDHGYKCLKKLLGYQWTRVLFASIHPRWSFALACKSSKSSRAADQVQKNRDIREKAKDKILIDFIQEKQKEKDYRYFIFAHRHQPKEIQVDKVVYLNTGDWQKHFSYVVFDGKAAHLGYFKN